MDSHIVKFIQKQKNLSLATCLNNQPHCANCFYAFDEDEVALIFKSSPETEHIQQMQNNPAVAGSILPDIDQVGTIKGVQFKGHYEALTELNLIRAKDLYYAKFPFARMVSGEFWKINLHWVKMTDNTLGFGKKLAWTKTKE